MVNNNNYSDRMGKFYNVLRELRKNEFADKDGLQVLHKTAKIEDQVIRTLKHDVDAIPEHQL